ncbi:MAG: hypothetical protein GY906_37035 [bacterium]|nr:hypothetical protein [bacterium]
MHGFENPFEFDMALLDPVHLMMHRGFRIDAEKKQEYHIKYHAEWQDFQAKLNSIAGHEVNVGSFPKMKVFLYEELGLPTQRHRGSGGKRGKITTDEPALRKLLLLSKKNLDSAKTENMKFKWLRAFMAVMLILKIRAVRKLIESYIDVKVDSDGRMRTTLSVGGASTMRFTSSKTLWDTGLNMQTVPVKLRPMFLADPGKELGEADLNRGESWIYSHLAEEPLMMQIHREGLDFHMITACAISEVFGERIRVEDWPKFAEADPDKAYQLRYMGKRDNHASAYRMGPNKLVEVVNKASDEHGVVLTKKQAQLAMALWIQEYKFIESWWSAIEHQLNIDRTMVTPYGRTQTFHDRWGDDLFRAATAYVPQSTAVDYTNGGLYRCFTELDRAGKWGFELLHQNHDSIVFQYDEGNRDKVLPAVRELMEQESVSVNSYDITIPVEASYGRSWGELTEYKFAA